MLGFIVTTAYWPGITGAAIQTGWAALWILGPLLILRRRVQMGPVHWLLFAFLIYAAVSTLWFHSGLFGFMKLAGLACAFIWATTLDDDRSAVRWLLAGVGVSSAMACWQAAGGLQFVGEALPRPSGLFVNPNVLAEVSALAVVLGIVARQPGMAMLAAPGLVLSASRGALVGLACACIAALWRLASVRTRVLVGMASPFLLVGMGMAWRPDTSIQRIALWRDTLDGFTVFGHGIGSFTYLFPAYANRFGETLRPDFAHNDVLQFGFELGIGILPLLAAGWLLLRSGHAYVPVLVCFVAISCFGFPSHVPASAFILAFVAGRVARAVPVVRADGDNRRPALSGGDEAGESRLPRPWRARFPV